MAHIGLWYLHLSSNYAGGAPGSFINLSGENFPPDQSIPISVNTYPLGDAAISADGTFTLTLATAHASQGIYYVKLDSSPPIQLKLRLDAREALAPRLGDFTVFDLPPGIALDKTFFLPILR
jgi:hypothetical protein